jgi:hypothetical protein
MEDSIFNFIRKIFNTKPFSLDKLAGQPGGLRQKATARQRRGAHLQLKRKAACWWKCSKKNSLLVFFCAIAKSVACWQLPVYRVRWLGCLALAFGSGK